LGAKIVDFCTFAWYNLGIDKLTSFRGCTVIKALEEKILKEGKVLPGDILKVDGFLNHCLDIPFLLEMGKEIARLYENQQITKILTIETSGIPIAFAAAQFMNVPVVFVKKNKTGNMSENVYSTMITSYTRKTEYRAVVSKEFLCKDDKVLVVDDFFATGNALKGLIDLLDQAGAELVGCAVAIEKGFQGGGDELRAKGIRVESLAIVESMTDDSLTFRK